MNAQRTRYALLIAADALQDDPERLEALVADDGQMTAQQVVDGLRIYAALLGQDGPGVPEPARSAAEQAETIARFAAAPDAPESLRWRTAEALMQAQWNVPDEKLADQPEGWVRHFLIGADAAIAVMRGQS